MTSAERAKLWQEIRTLMIKAIVNHKGDEVMAAQAIDEAFRVGTKQGRVEMMQEILDETKELTNG
jgi:hypothetical protein